MHRDNTLNLPKTGQKKENPFKGNIGHSLSPPPPAWAGLRPRPILLTPAWCGGCDAPLRGLSPEP